jgi:hypothetical protein
MVYVYTTFMRRSGMIPKHERYGMMSLYFYETCTLSYDYSMKLKIDDMTVLSTQDVNSKCSVCGVVSIKR